MSIERFSHSGYGKKTKNCVKNGSAAQNPQKIKAKVWRFSVLFTGFFGQQNRIFGKFVGFFIWKCLEAPINDDEFLGNSMIRVRNAGNFFLSLLILLFLL